MIGVLGGAFNPPHIGHLGLAQAALTQLRLSEVLLVPMGRAPHREIEDDPGADVRLEMTALATLGTGVVDVDPYEVEAAAGSESPSYTYLTLEAFKERDPGVDLVLLLGADAAAGFDRWKRPERILELAPLGIACRAGVPPGAEEEALARIDAGDLVLRFELPPIDVSSTAVRERVQRGEEIGTLVSDPVAALIDAEGLYRG